MSAARLDQTETIRDRRPSTLEQADRRPGDERKRGRWTDDLAGRGRRSVEASGAPPDADRLDVELWFG